MDNPFVNIYHDILAHVINVQCWLMMARGDVVYHVIDGFACLFPRYGDALFDWFDAWVQEQIDWMEKNTP